MLLAEHSQLVAELAECERSGQLQSLEIERLEAERDEAYEALLKHHSRARALEMLNDLSRQIRTEKERE